MTTPATPATPSSHSPRGASQRALWAALALLLLVSLAGAGLSAAADRGFGRVEVQKIEFMTDLGVPMTAKVYKPAWVNADDPAPGLLAGTGPTRRTETGPAAAVSRTRTGSVAVFRS